MLDQLVESKSNAHENTRRSGFLLTVFVIMTTIMIGGWLYSLFAKRLRNGRQRFRTFDVSRAGSRA